METLGDRPPNLNDCDIGLGEIAANNLAAEAKTQDIPSILISPFWRAFSIQAIQSSQLFPGYNRTAG